MKRKSASLKPERIAVFAGGSSPERKISLKSGAAVDTALRAAGFETLFFDTGRVSTREIFSHSFDAVFIALHGAGGEDGTCQRMLEKRGMPYVGSGVEGCRLSFDKSLTKKALVQAGLPTPEYFIASKLDWKKRLAGKKGAFYVKPFRDGSSLGIIRIAHLEKSHAQVRRHLARYGKLIFEREVSGREVTVGILNDQPLPVIELKPKRKFYDYRAKYTKGLCRYVIPAKLEASKTRQLQKLALEVHRVLKLKDFSRIDIMLDAKLNPFVLEANAIPGFTEFSLLPKAAAERGISFEQLCAGLVKRACQRFQS